MLLPRDDSHSTLSSFVFFLAGLEFSFFTVHFFPILFHLSFLLVCPEYILRRHLFLLVILFWKLFSYSVLCFTLLRFLIPIYTYLVPTEVEYDLEQWFSTGDDFAPQGTFGNV